MKESLLPFKPWICLLQWLGLLLAATVLAVGIAFVIPNDGSVEYLKWMQFIQSAGTLILPAWLVAYLWTKHPIQWLHMDIQKRSYSIQMVCGICVLWMVVSVPGINLLNHLNQQMELPACLAGVEAWMKQAEEAAEALVERFIKADSIWILLINIGLMALVPAIGEEMTFRGVLLNLFSSISSKKNTSKVPHAAIWIIAVIFSAVHLQFYGFFPRMLLGAALGYIAVWTGSLWMAILVHFTNNTLTVLMYYIAEQHHWNQDVLDSIGTGNTLWLGIMSVVVSAGLLYGLYRICYTGSTSDKICTPLQEA